MAFKMKGSPMKRNFGIGSGSPAKFQGAFIDGKRVSYDRAMDAIESGEGNVELTNKEARKYAEEQGELDFINKVRKEDRKRIANMTPEERKEHRRLLSEDAARQANIDKLNYREGLGYKLTDKEKEERAGSTYDPETGEYSDDDLQPGVRAGSYEFLDKSPMKQVQKYYKTDMYNKAFPKKKKKGFTREVFESARPKKVTRVYHLQGKKRPTETIEKAMKKGKEVVMKRDMTKPKQYVVRKKARLVEKPKKKTGKISTKTMELE